jgi:NitT/TauT family transport system substrate-binding protein
MTFAVGSNAKPLATMLLLLCSLALGCGKEPNATDSKAADGLTKVTLQLNWYPEAEHGGYYAALVHGYFKEAGLDVEILAGGRDTPVIQQVASGRVTFGVVNADNILYGRAEQAPVVALMAPLQTSPRCIIVHKASGIREFSQLKDMTLAMSTTQAFSFYLRKKVPLTGVTIVPYTGDVAQFLTNPRYGQQGYIFSEPYIAERNGGDPYSLMLADLGFNPYTSLLFTSEKVIAQQSQIIEQITAASVRGWKKYLEDPQSTNAYIHSKNPAMDLDVLEYGAKAIVPLARSAEANAPFGAMTTERWKTLLDQMIECGQIEPHVVDINQVFQHSHLKPSSK